MDQPDTTDRRVGPGSPPAGHLLPIGPHTKLPGAEVIPLTDTDGAEVGKVLGRIVARSLPCTVESATGSGLGCAESDGTLLVRHPISGMNLPGERVVGQTQFCPRCGPSLPCLVTPTRDEADHGWAPGTTT